MVLNAMSGYHLPETPMPVSVQNYSAPAEGQLPTVNEGMAIVSREPVWGHRKRAACRSMSNEVFSEPPEMLIARVSASSVMRLGLPGTFR
jgi:hypothetical protein